MPELPAGFLSEFLSLLRYIGRIVGTHLSPRYEWSGSSRQLAVGPYNVRTTAGVVSCTLHELSRSLRRG